MPYRNSIFIALGGLALISASPAAADPKVGFEPPYDVERTATVGSPIVERFNYDAVSIAVPKADVSKVVLFMIRINAGEQLQAVYSSVKLKACVDGWGPCALDDEGDGTFDRIAKDKSSTAFKLSASVPYDLKEIANPKARSFRQVVSYSGATGDTLRLSYREFANDMARPAFSEDLTLPLGKTFPQKIAFKDVRLTILALNGEGLRYRVERPQ